MGFLGDVRALTRQGHQLQRDMDVAGQLDRMRTSMADASRALGQHAAAAAAAADGVPGEATVVVARDTGTRIQGQALLELDLVVELPGSAPFQASTTMVVPQLDMPHVLPGGQLGVRAVAADGPVHVERFGPA